MSLEASAMKRECGRVFAERDPFQRAEGITGCEGARRAVISESMGQCSLRAVLQNQARN
jgi:hypothetical protein